MSTNKATSNKKTTTETNPWIIIFAIIFIDAILIGLYLKYKVEIYNFFLLSSIFIASLCLSAIYSITKRDIKIDKDFKYILIWILITTIFIPINLYLLDNPIFFYDIDKTLISNTMQKNGSLSILTEYGTEIFGHLLYQVMGILIMFCLVIYLVIGNINVWSMVNLGLNARLYKLWKWLYINTYNLVSTKMTFIGISILLIVMSFLFSSGILIHLITNINS